MPVAWRGVARLSLSDSFILAVALPPGHAARRHAARRHARAKHGAARFHGDHSNAARTMAWDGNGTTPPCRTNVCAPVCVRVHVWLTVTAAGYSSREQPVGRPAGPG